MSKVFVGGSRRIIRLHPEVTARLDQMIAKQVSILVGDANGADKSLQHFLKAKEYRSRETDSGLMIWDHKSAGTLMNAFRLVRQGKRVSIFEAQHNRFQELQNESEWTDFFSRCSDEVKRRIEKLSASDSEIAAPVQASLL